MPARQYPIHEHVEAAAREPRHAELLAAIAKPRALVRALPAPVR